MFTTRTPPAKSGLKPKDAPATAGAALRRFLSEPGCLLLLALVLLFAVLRLAQGPLTWLDVLIALLTLAVWPMIEWSIHVGMLHFRPKTLFGRQIDFLLPQTHRWHHADPWNLHWVFIPRHIFPLVLPALIGLVFWLSPNISMASTILAVYLLLALHYEWVHYLAHINWCPPLTYYQRRVREHRLHHFRNEKRWWGVSMGLGDRIMGTAAKATDVAASASTSDILR